MFLSKDDTCIDAPETPAHVFAARAFKHAIFGTPRPPSPVVGVSRSLVAEGVQDVPVSEASEAKVEIIKPVAGPSEGQKRKDREELNHHSELMSSPSKPRGILVTPGTAMARRKQVNFGEQVVDNEGKRSKYSKSGLPDKFPGKFPSPWTPHLAELEEIAGQSSSEKKMRRLLEKRSKPVVVATQVRTESGRQVIAKTDSPRAKDDSDITLDLSEPRSSSGRYWKEQYLSYAAESEAEMKRLIAKHKVAKEYARLKDGEATELRQQLETERNRRREKSLESEVKDLRERLRKVMSENAKLCGEITGLRLKIEDSTAGSGKTKQSASSAPGSRLADVAGPILEDNELELENDTIVHEPTSFIESRDMWLEDDSNQENSMPVSEQRIKRPVRPRSRNKVQVTKRPINLRSQQLHPIAERASPKDMTTIHVPIQPLSERSPNVGSHVRDNLHSHSKVSITTQGIHFPSDSPTTQSPVSVNGKPSQIFDPQASIQALALQADQPITPLSVRNRSSAARRQNGTPTKPIPKERSERAKARVEARLAAAKARRG